MFLVPFDFAIKHRPRKSNPIDTLSKRLDYIGKDLINYNLLLEL